MVSSGDSGILADSCAVGAREVLYVAVWPEPAFSLRFEYFDSRLGVFVKNVWTLTFGCDSLVVVTELPDTTRSGVAQKDRCWKWCE